MIIILITSNHASAQETWVQSGIIRYLTSHMEWPDSKDPNSIQVYVVGETPVYDLLVNEKEDLIKEGKEMTVTKVSSVNQVPAAHIIYLSKGKTSEIENARSRSKAIQSLLITAASTRSQKGGINFTMKNERHSLEINDSFVTSCGIRIASKLKNFATLID